MAGRPQARTMVQGATERDTSPERFRADVNTFERSDKDCPSRRRSAAGLSARPPKIAFGELRASGVRDVLVYCRNHRCSHSVEISADAGLMTSGSRTSNRASSAPPAASAAPSCGRSFRRRAWVLLASAVVRAASMVGGWRRSHATKCASPRRAARQGMWESCIGATDLQ